MSELKIPAGTGDHIQGDPQAPITLVEYGDYECPHCGAAYPIVKRVQKHFGKRMRFVFRNFPLVQAHPNAQSAAEAAEFAAAQGKFWEMHDAIYEHQQELSMDFLLRLGEKLGLEGRALAKALKDEAFAEKVRADFLGGVRSGVNGTPTFFINGHRHDGPFDYGDLVDGIEEASG
ncbi:MAG TPA: thioredoxin domain-containing protein [Terriglobales bacterium]|jgi:protein-disulfide isomerase